MKAEDFMAQTKPRGGRSALRTKEAEIMAMVKADYAYHQITFWLSMCGISVEIEAVREFVNESESLAVIKSASKTHLAERSDGASITAGTRSRPMTGRRLEPAVRIGQ